MQAASSPYLPPPQSYYQSLYHIQPLAPQDHELKRQYLALLPPQHIIEICLTFDVHVPPYIRGTIWPQDLCAAIANLRKPAINGDGSASASPQKDNDKPPEPIMASLEKPPDKPNNPEPNSSSTDPQVAEPQPPDKSTENAGAAKTTPASPTPTPAPAPTASAVPVSMQPQYPHQSFGYSQHAPVTYPHAPYYPPLPGYPSYLSTSYPHYPAPVPNGYLHPHVPPPPPPPHPSYPPPQPNAMYPTPHVPQTQTQEQGTDDLPSYEEMIVTALQESADPEGCAPKDLFAWMAARYPLQSNFRPSASQALQKAFKRGRLEKSNNGKYRLSATWEGGNTSKRTTRRPQMQTQQTNPMTNPSGSPFTHAPLIHHHQQQNTHSSHYPGQPYPYPYPPGYPEYLPQPAQPQPPQATSSGAVQTTTDTTDKSAGTVEPSSDVDRDTYEAARNILKAINFGGLFSITSGPEGDDLGSKKPDDISVDQLTSLLVQTQDAVSGGQMDAGGTVQQQVIPPRAAPLPTLSTSAGVAVAVPNVSGGDVRAELQAQLALLAAQLVELSQENGENGVVVQSGNQSTQVAAPPTPVGSLSQTSPQPQTLHSEEQRPRSPRQMVCDPPLMDALVPPPGFSFPTPQAQSQQQPAPPSQQQTPPSETQKEPPPKLSELQLQELQPQEDIPIDPVLQGLNGTADPTPQSAPAPDMLLKNRTQIKADPTNSNSTINPQSSASAPPPPIFAAPASESDSTLVRTSTAAPMSVQVFMSQPAPESPVVLEPEVVRPNFVDGDTESDDDDDMEEIA